MIGVPTHSPVKRLGLDCPPTSRKPLSQAPDPTHTAPHGLPHASIPHLQDGKYYPAPEEPERQDIALAG